MNQKKNIIVLGSVNTDFVLVAKKLPHAGETVLGTEFFQTLGGKGANQAVAASRAGGTVQFIGAVGEDHPGNQAIEQLKHAGVDIARLAQHPNAHTGIAMIMVDAAGNNLIGVAPGANSLVTEATIKELPKQLFFDTLFVCQLETPRSAVRQALQTAKESGATTIFNPAPADSRIVDEGFLDFVDFLVVNEAEAMLLSEGRSESESHPDIHQILNRLHELGAKTIIATLGERGYVISEHGKRQSEAGHKVKAIDTIGAGDTFVGALACQIAWGRSPTISACFANCAAAISVTKKGAQASIPHRIQIEQFMKLNTSHN